MTVSLELPYINGAPHPTHSQDTLEAVNPADGELLALIGTCDSVDVDLAVAAASESQKEWAIWEPARRGAALLRWADLVESHAEELATLDTRNMGRVLRETTADVGASARMIRYWAGYVDRMTGSQIPATRGHLSYTVREPLGVIGVIMPWNGPLASFCSRVAPAVACGNGVVAKPSEWSPMSANRLAALAIDAGMPIGLVNVVTGAGETGALVAGHPGIHGITFTGSVATGRAIARAAADTFKKVVLEMGGKSPNVVFDDADLDAALRGSTWGIFNNAGQVCVAGTRLLVQRSIAPEFVEQLRQRAARVRVGDPMDPTTHMGPIVCQRQLQRVRGYVEVGRDEGATLLTGGDAPADTNPNGFFFEPTIFGDVAPSMRISREEIFGPVLSVIPFDDEDDAVELANDVPYGLSANIWTRDLGRMLRMAERVEAGTIWGNTMRLHHPALPFGGFKASGLGGAYADGAVEGSTRVRRVSIRFADTGHGPGWEDV